MSSLPPTRPSVRPAAGRCAARRTGAVLATAAVALGLAITPGLATAAPEPTGAAAPVDAPRGAIAVVEGATEFTVEPRTAERLREHGLRLVRVDHRGRTREAVPAGTSLQLDVTSGVITNMAGRIGGRVLYENRGLAVINTKTRQVAQIADFESDLTRQAVLASVNDADSIAVGAARSPRFTRETLDIAARKVTTDARVRLTGQAAEQLNRATGTEAFARGAVFANVSSRFDLDQDQDVRAALGLDRDLNTTDKAQSTPQGIPGRDRGRAEDELATEENLRKAFPNAVG